jgi:nitrogen fixation/metabolism regulation signal transduction histidine kinase
MLQLRSDKSRLQKKLTLYFILIAVVSISVSIEMIFEFSSTNFRDEIQKNIIAEVKTVIPGQYVEKIDHEKMDMAIKDPISNFRNRIGLVFIVICASIIGAFKMFTNDIVAPMENIVEATKKIADGDLTVTVPVMSQDEIGQIAKLINDMNVNLQDMIMQIKQEIERHKIKIQEANKTITSVPLEDTNDIIGKKEIRLSDFKRMIKLSSDVVKLNETMMIEIEALETFINMYKTYSIGGVDIGQSELDKALEQYNK